MSAKRPRRDDDLTELPWASVFDPAANARALSAIQAQGFRAASELVDRFAEIARHAATGEPTMPVRDAGGPVINGAARAPQGLNPDVDMIISTWWTIVGQMFRAMRGEGPARGGNQASVDVATDTAAGSVQMAVAGREPTGEADAELWMHNTGADDEGEVVLRCSDLLAHDGSVIKSKAVHFTPAVMALPGRSSRGVEVRVARDKAMAPGRYRGTILVSGHPDVWLHVEVDVRPSPT